MSLTAGVSLAAKPVAPVVANCSAISSSGDIYKVQCEVSAVSAPAPELVIFSGLDDAEVKVTEAVSPNKNGLGKWLLTVELKVRHSIRLPFEARYSGGTVVRVGGAFNPFRVSEKSDGAVQGVTMKRKGAPSVQEFLSK